MFVRFVLVLCMMVIGSLSTRPANGSVILTTSAIDTADLDFDGPGTQTTGDLGFATTTFMLTGGDIPSDPLFDNITSISLTFTAIGGPGATFSTTSGFTSPKGLGIRTPGEFGPHEIFLSSNDEFINVAVSSTSTTGDQVLLSGVEFNSWSNFFPLSEAELSGGATFDSGQTVLTGGGGVGGVVPILNFDTAVSSFSVSANNEPIRVANIRLTVSAIPEPSTIVLATLSLLCCGWRRKRG